MAAHQAPLSLGFSRQEYWSGLPFPSRFLILSSPIKNNKQDSIISNFLMILLIILHCQPLAKNVTAPGPSDLFLGYSLIPPGSMLYLLSSSILLPNYSIPQILISGYTFDLHK